MNEAYLVDGTRTPFGTFGGSLKDKSPADLGTHVTRETLELTGISADQIDEIFFGNVIPTDSNSIYLARHIGLKSALPQSSPALTLNRLCGSGLESVVQAASSIMLGRIQAAIAGGVEIMSQAPYISTGARWGNQYGNATLEDMLFNGLTDNYVNLPMGGTAENLAEKYKISREEQDEWAGISQSRAEKARVDGLLAQEITPVILKTRKGDVEFKDDEFIRGAASIPKLPNLKPVFKKEGGTVTAGNASGINDGASAVAVASGEFVKAQGLQPLARIIGFASRGCDPSMMGIGPVNAIPEALKMAGKTLADMDLMEVNEAFAAQFLSVQKELGLDKEKTNVNGGAIAIGHPLGASGNRVLLTLAKELKRRDGKFGVASLCIGGGQGIAMVIESV